MNNNILLLGATGNLGLKISKELIAKGALVTALVRNEVSSNKIAELENLGIKCVMIDFNDHKALVSVCLGKDCIVSALSGLKEVIVDLQSKVLDAAIEAKVPRFIPSDFSIDFTNLIPGKNRNLDYRRDFHSIINKSPIQVTSIFNGAFMELLTGDMPLILKKQQRILCWGNADEKLEFTITDDVAEYTAYAALDESSPRYLRICGDSLSCNEFVNLVGKIDGLKYKILKPGGIGLLNFMIKLTRFFSPGKTELYPPWQGMQYMRDMMEGRIQKKGYDNTKHTMNWLDIESYLNKSYEK